MHDCSNCGCACYCHGDIDDCPVETIEYAYMHCTGCGCHDEDVDGFFDDDRDDGPYDSGPYESEWDWIIRAHDEHIAR